LTNNPRIENLVTLSLYSAPKILFLIKNGKSILLGCCLIVHECITVQYVVGWRFICMYTLNGKMLSKLVLFYYDYCLQIWSKLRSFCFLRTLKNSKHNLQNIQPKSIIKLSYLLFVALFSVPFHISKINL
jgi:hypothetical protein